MASAPQPKQHRLATDPHARLRPFLSTALVAYMTKLYHELHEDAHRNYLLILDLTNRIVARAAALGIKSAPGSKTEYAVRVQSIAAKCAETKNYEVGARLLVREAMRLMCTVRAPGNPQLSVVRRVDVDQAVVLLYESLQVLMSPDTPEAKEMQKNGTIASVGCGSWGEVFFEKHQGEAIELFVFAGIFSDLFCAFINKHVVNEPEGSEKADQLLAALLEFTSIHPCAEQCVVFQSEIESGKSGDVLEESGIEEETEVVTPAAVEEAKTASTAAAAVTESE
jgi:hypothetical protein